MQISSTSDRAGIVELLEDLTTTQSATTSSYPLASKIRDVNNAYANYMQLAVSASGKWQVDDTNQTDYPIITTNLVANQQDYSFTVDGSTPTNQILDIHRIEVADASGNFHVLRPIDQQELKGVALSEFMESASQPAYYDKTSNGIFLYPKSSYNATGGLKIYFSRTPSYFLSSDTTKKPGIPDMFHEYLALRPAYLYCLRKGLPQAKNYAAEVVSIENRIKEYYRDRSKDDVMRISTVYSSSR